MDLVSIQLTNQCLSLFKNLRLSMKKVFVFCIGGTGIRVMKSITMMMAGGMDTNGYMVVPVIIDPHLDLEEKKNLHSLLDSYINIYQQ